MGTNGAVALGEEGSADATALRLSSPPMQRMHRSKLSWECQAELFRQEMENADDIRLNVRLFRCE